MHRCYSGRSWQMDIPRVLFRFAGAQAFMQSSPLPNSELTNPWTVLRKKNAPRRIAIRQ
jgi:hypothetical protein